MPKRNQITGSSKAWDVAAANHTMSERGRLLGHANLKGKGSLGHGLARRGNGGQLESLGKNGHHLCGHKATQSVPPPSYAHGEISGGCG